MGCKVGYPDAPCPFGFEGRVTRATCGSCKNFIPPQHILQWCKLYDREGVVCQRPKSDCAACPEKNERGPGRPAEGRIDWRNPEDTRVYQKELMRSRRAQGIVEPTPQSAEYHRAYYAKNKERILERRRARRQAKREQGGGEV